jgi:hypothetical protein
MSYFLEYKDGLCLSTQPFINGNVHLSTAAWILYKKDPEFLQKARKFLTYCELKPGLYKRNPTNDDEHGPDDMFGLPLYGEDIANQVIDHLNSNFGFYKVKKFQVKSNLFRFLPLIAHIYICANKKPNLLLQIAWCVAQSFPSTTQDGIIQTALMQTTYKESKVKTWLMTKYCKNTSKEFLSKIYADYINDPSHPLANL